MPAKKKQDEKTKGFKKFQTDFKNALKKIKKKEGGTHNKYEPGPQWNPSQREESEQYSAYLMALRTAYDSGESPEQSAIKLSSQAEDLGIIKIKTREKKEKKEPKEASEEDLKREYKEDQEKPGALQMSFREFLLTQGTRVPLRLLARESKTKEEKDVKEEKEPTPVIDRPNKPLIDVKESPQRVILPADIQARIDRKVYDDPEWTKEDEQRYQEKRYRTPEQAIIEREKAWRDLYENSVYKDELTYEEFLSRMGLRILPESKVEPTPSKVEPTPSKEPTKEALSQRKVRIGQKTRALEEKEVIAKMAKEEGIKIGEERILQKLREGKIQPPPLVGELPPGIQTVRDVVPEIIGSGVGLIGAGKGVQGLVRKGASGLLTYFTDMFRSQPDAKITVDIPSTEYKLRPIPVGLTGAYKYMEKYLQIYNRLSPEEKKKLEEIDKKLMTIKQQQTRAPQNEKVVKSFHSKIGQIINKMDRDIKDAKELNNDIKKLEEQIKKIPNEVEQNFEPSLDNRLQLGLGQVMEMKRSGNFLPQLVLSSARVLPTLSPPEIVEALNSVIANVTEVEMGAVQRVGDQKQRIPQITPTQAVQIKQAITGPLLAGSQQQREEEKKGEPDIEGPDDSVPEAEKKEEVEEKKEEVEKKDERSYASSIIKTLSGLGVVGGVVSKLLPEVSKNIYSNIMETPITMPETQAQSDQKISSATGTMRPRFIVPSRDSVIPSMPKIRADDIQFSAFDYVPPGTEGGNGTARTNPLVLSQELEERLRYSNAGITISPGMGENVISMILTESELKALLLPRGPEVSPVIYEFPIIDGDQSQNEVKRYDQNLIQVEKFSPYNEYNDNDQLDEEVFGSILLSYVP